MAELYPFPALMPEADVAHRVATLPYDVMSRAEAKQMAADNPLSFLRISRSEIELPDDASPLRVKTDSPKLARVDDLKQGFSTEPTKSVIDQRVADLLTRLKNEYPERTISVMSSLAEGADRGRDHHRVEDERGEVADRDGLVEHHRAGHDAVAEHDRR